MVPRRLAELRKAQLVHVAFSQFGVVLNPNHRLDDLADEVRPLLASVMQCDCAGCKGGVCDPDLHILQPTEYQPPASNGSDDVEALLLTSQADQQITPSGSPSLSHPDGTASRLALGHLALQRLGVSPLDLVSLQEDHQLPTIEEEVLPDGQQDVLPPATAAATGGPPLQTTSKSIAKGLSNVVRNLLNPLGSTPRMTSPGSTPRTLTPRITIPLVRPPPGLPSGLPRPAATNQAQISFPAPRQPGPVRFTLPRPVRMP